MECIRLSEEEKQMVLISLSQKEKDVLPIAGSILQRIAGIYINKEGNPEMADMYRLVAGTFSDLAKE